MSIYHIDNGWWNMNTKSKGIIPLIYSQGNGGVSITWAY